MRGRTRSSLKSNGVKRLPVVSMLPLRGASMAEKARHMLWVCGQRKVGLATATVIFVTAHAASVSMQIFIAHMRIASVSSSYAVGLTHGEDMGAIDLQDSLVGNTEAKLLGRLLSEACTALGQQQLAAADAEAAAVHIGCLQSWLELEGYGLVWLL